MIHTSREGLDTYRSIQKYIFMGHDVESQQPNHRRRSLESTMAYCFESTFMRGLAARQRMDSKPWEAVGFSSSPALWVACHDASRMSPMCLLSFVGSLAADQVDLPARVISIMLF